MIITFKTLQQKTFKIEIDDTEKVRTLKEKITQERGDEFPVEGQKLIYAGKILDDEKLISEYSIDTEKNFVVVMAVKAKKAAEKPNAATGQSTSSSSSSAPVTPATPTATTETPTTAPASETTATDSSTTAGTEQPAESALLTGSALESSVTELMSLGYSREQVMRALNASFHNADRAAEYLLSGNIPDVGQDDAPPAEEGGDNVTPPAIPTSGDLSFLSSLPQFQLLRNQVRQHPESLPQLLQEIGQSNPQLLAMISQNQQAFIDLLNSAPDDAPASGGGGGGGGPPGSGYQIQVTTEEKAIIDRIVGMGFQEADVIQAFFACEKNEQLTINFLLQ